MEIIFKSYHLIDVENKMAIRKNKSKDYEKIVEKVVQNISDNPSQKRYKTESERTIVASIIKDIMKIDINDPMANNLFDNYSDEIADKLKIEEIKIQEQIKHLNKIQKGSLIQALVKSNDGKYNYHIAKVEHRNYVDENELLLKGGFDPEKNEIWKTCTFGCNVNDEEIDVSQANVYLNHKATYWIKNFLELVELTSDEKNTRDAWSNIEYNLKHKLQKKFPSDYFTLRNAVIAYFRKPNPIQFEKMINDIFDEYEPISTDSKCINELKDIMLRLPKEKNFDSSFISKPKEVKAKIKSLYKINKDVDIIIREGIDSSHECLKDIIHTRQNSEGEQFIEIKVTDTKTYNMFNLKEV